MRRGSARPKPSLSLKTEANNMQNSQARALSGIRVLDLTQWEAGSICAQSLAFLGADVIKIEKPQGGDPARIASADSADSDSLYFLVLNSNKRAITIDLAKDEGKALLRKLVAKCDVLLENFAPGTIKRLGFDYDSVREINPRIVYGSISGFSDESPYRDFRSFDAIAQSVGGAVAFTGEAGGAPMKPGFTFADTGSGLHLAIGVVAALHQRHVTGKGQFVKVAMQEVMVNFGRMPLARTQLTGRAAERVGNSSPSSTAAPSGLYACKGGGPNDYCFIYTARDQFSGNKQWHALLRTIGRPELIDDPRFADPQARFARKDEVDAVIAPWMAQQDKRVAMEELNGAGVPAGAVFDSLDIINDRSLYATGMLTKVQHPTRGEVTLAGWPMKMTGSSTPAVSAPPLLGQHTSEVLAEILDMNAEEVAALRSRGAI